MVAVARLDLAELLRSRWLAFCATVYALLGALFVFVAMRESTVLGFTGMGRVLLSVIHVLVLFLPLLALTGTTQTLAHARDEGALELLLSQPIPRRAYFFGVAAVRYLVLLVPLVALVALMSALGTFAFAEDVPWAFVGKALAISAALLWAFVGLGLAVATIVRNQAKAMMYGLLLWALGVALLDFALVGMMLAWRVDARAVFLLASLNPVESARMALLSTAQPDLAALGPVGFFMSTRVGPGALLALGIAWPAVVGLAAFTAALRRFCRDDLI
jgi:ABC-type transport system involved in multi-copper enzyme maturation permease subunit